MLCHKILSDQFLTGTVDENTLSKKLVKMYLDCNLMYVLIGLYMYLCISYLAKYLFLMHIAVKTIIDT